MRMKTVSAKSSLLLSVCLATFAGAGFAGTVSVPATDRMIVAQVPDQDPKTPPDCKKYPKDVRCPSDNEAHRTGASDVPANAGPGVRGSRARAVDFSTRSSPTSTVGRR